MNRMFLQIAFGILVVASIAVVVAARQASKARTESARACAALSTTLSRKIEHTCATGRGALGVVRIKLQRDDPDAVDVARDFFTYGQPWLALCGVDPDAVEFLTADRAQLIALLAEIEQRLTATP